MGKSRAWPGLVVGLMMPLLLIGCGVPIVPGVFPPIPVPPWTTERMMEKYLFKNDYRTVVLGPIPDGAPPPQCEDEPDDAQVLRAASRITRGIPFIYQESRDDIQIVKERIADHIDPPRFYPLVGYAQQHHCKWKCTIYYTETIEAVYPIPLRLVQPRVEVVYIDKNHLHLYVPNNSEAQNIIARDMSGMHGAPWLPMPGPAAMGDVQWPVGRQNPEAPNMTASDASGERSSPQPPMPGPANPAAGPYYPEAPNMTPGNAGGMQGPAWPGIAGPANPAAGR